MHNCKEKVSVIIPVYNGQDTLRATVLSALNQTWWNLEVIVVDDGSEMTMEPILQELADDRIFYYYKAGRSNANVARNYGIERSSGDYIAMLDADDQWLDDHVESCLAFLQETGADGLYGSLYLSRDKAMQVENCQIFIARALQEDESMIDYLLAIGFGAQTSSLFTTAATAKDILWNPDLIDHQDYDFVVRFHKKYMLVPKLYP